MKFAREGKAVALQYVPRTVSTDTNVVCGGLTVVHALSVGGHKNTARQEYATLIKFGTLCSELHTGSAHSLMFLKRNQNAPSRPGSLEVTILTRWDVSSIPANVIILTKKLKTKTKNAQRVEND